MIHFIPDSPEAASELESSDVLGGPGAAGPYAEAVARLASIRQALACVEQFSGDETTDSMGDDLAAGRRTEVDYLNGELVRLAERLGLDAPVNRKVVELIRKAEDGAPPYAPADLRREVLRR